jgi:two-component system, NarL family, response regulator LiaR
LRYERQNYKVSEVKMRVAIVEDHSLLRTGIRGVLADKCEIQVVGDAATATGGLTLLQETQPDVAIVDIVLPDYSGIELIRQFRSSNPSDVQTKFLILTGFPNEALVLEAFAAGVGSYCVKTSDSRWLLDALMTTYEGEPWLDPAISRIVLKYAQAADAPISQLESPLTEQEIEVLELIVQGYRNDVIAKRLYISLSTVKARVRSILSKLQASDRAQAVAISMRAGIIR